MRQALKAIPLFKELVNEDLDTIAALLKRISYSKGETIFCQGDIGDAMYLVESGQVVVWDENANEALAYLGQGSFAGELALLLPEPRSASLKVALDADLYVLKKEDFDQLLSERPAIALQMMRELGQRLRSTSQKQFKTQSRRISALWGTDYIELIKTLSLYTEDPISVIPLPGCAPPPDDLDKIAEVHVSPAEDISIENLAGQLGLQVDIFEPVVMLLPIKVSSLGRRALALADTVISIGSSPQWLVDNIPITEIWETTNAPKQLNRIARRLTGHTVGLVFSQGSAKGLAHIGVIKTLRAENIPIDYIAGSSVGALFGAFLAAGWSDERFETFADETQSIVSRWLNWDVNLPPKAGFIKGNKVRDLIDEWLDHKEFEDLDIPFYCVAADILTGQEVVFGPDQPNKANLADAVRASISLPILFNPWEINGQYLMDGGLVNPVPAQLLCDKGTDIIIISNVVEGLDKAHPETNPKMPHFLKIINNIVTLAADELSKSQLALPNNILIHTQVNTEHALDVKNAREFIKAGEKAARGQISAIKARLETFSSTTLK